MICWGDGAVTVDFHVHSSASDGTCRPGEIAERARGGGFTALALTDHDNCDGVPALLAADGGPCRLYAGVELSIDPGEGFDRLHLLGVGVDPAAPSLKSLLARILEGRNGRNDRIRENFARIGIDIPPGELAAFAAGEIVARPHFAAWLIAHGFAKDQTEAFDKYLLKTSPAATRCYESRWRPSQEDAFRAVHDAGGLCVMAHPKYWREPWKRYGVDYRAAAAGIAALREKGLDALEALYQANSKEETVEFSRIADAAGLLKSAGSDFHGANKPGIRLGMQVDEAFIMPFLEALESRSVSGSAPGDRTAEFLAALADVVEAPGLALSDDYRRTRLWGSLTAFALKVMIAQRFDRTVALKDLDGFETAGDLARRVLA